MSFIKCIDAVSMVVDEATTQFAPIWKVNNQKYDILRQYCSVIDSLADEFNGESFVVSVDDMKMTISVCMECPEMVVDDKQHLFYSLIKRAVMLKFSTSQDNNLNIEFTFPSVWERS